MESCPPSTMTEEQAHTLPDPTVTVTGEQAHTLPHPTVTVRGEHQADRELWVGSSTFHSPSF